MGVEILIVLGIIGVIAGVMGSRKKKWKDIDIPMPAERRNDLRYGYYLSLPGEMNETGDHTNLFWHAQFYGTQQLAIEMGGRTHELVIDCGPNLFVKENGAKKASLAPDAREKLVRYFEELKSFNLLHRVNYLVPMDEPNFFCVSEDHLRSAVNIMKDVASTYPELNNVKYVCIYGSDTSKLWCIELFDIVGIDNYGQKSEVLTRGDHATLMKHILPGQQVLILPGAAYGQNPDSFVAYAHSTPQVWGVVPFIWAHVPASADVEHWTGLSKRSEAEKDVYRNAGLVTMNRK